VPTAKLPVTIDAVATPELTTTGTGAELSAVPPSKNVTAPGALAGEIVAVRVTAAPGAADPWGDTASAIVVPKGARVQVNWPGVLVAVNLICTFQNLFPSTTPVGVAHAMPASNVPGYRSIPVPKSADA
jgi:hypothetical protein